MDDLETPSEQPAPEPAAAEEPLAPETGRPAPDSAPVADETAPLEQPAPEPVTVEQLLGPDPNQAAEADGSPVVEATAPAGEAQLRAVLEALVYVAEEPLTLAQIAVALEQPVDRIRDLIGQLTAEFDRPEHGVTIREIAGGYKMATKPEHHEAVRAFVKSLKPPLKLSLPALETLAVIAYKQPVTAPEIMEIRGVQGTGVLKTLLDRKLIAAAGRKAVVGKPILYKTTKEFLIQFGLKDLSELPSLKEFEEIRRMAMADEEPDSAPEGAPPESGAAGENPAPAVAADDAVETSGEPAAGEPPAEVPVPADAGEE